MEIVQYLRAVARSWWLILLALVAGGLGGYLVYNHATPEYRTTAQMSVKLNAPGLDQVSAQSLAGAQAQQLALVAHTPPAIADAQKFAGTSGSLSVAASAAASQPYVYITVSSHDAALAQKVANAYVHTLAASALAQTGPSSTPFVLNPVSAAPLPLHPFSPVKKHDLAFGLAAGLLLGLALAFLREALNNTIRNGDQLQRTSELTLLGTVPRELPKKLLPASSNPRSARAEAYRQVRTALHNATPHRPLVIAFTSAMLGEGKTSVVTNVAAVLSRAGHSVAVIDADLRRPRVAAVFGIEPGRGLAEVLQGTANIEHVLHHFDDGRLGVLTAGQIPANPSELLGDVKMMQTLQWFAERFEFVLLDTPPVLPVTDALVIAPTIQGVVLVSRLGYITRARLTHALGALDRVHATVIGIVANQAGKGSDSDYRYPYSYEPPRRRGSTASAQRPPASPPPRSATDPLTGGDGAARHAAYGDPFRSWSAPTFTPDVPSFVSEAGPELPTEPSGQTDYQR